jgi:hypothetical protein
LTRFKSRLEKVISRAFPEESLARGNSQVLEVYYKLAFVLVKTFTAKWQPPASLSIPTTSLPIPGTGMEMEGVVFEKHSLPPDMSAFIVKVSAMKYIEMQRTILNASDIQRSKQCRELYDVKTQKEHAKRPKTLSEFGTCATFKDVQSKFKQAQEDTEARNRERTFQQDSTSASVIVGKLVQPVQRVCRGRFDDDDDDRGYAAPKAKGKAGPKGTRKFEGRHGGAKFTKRGLSTSGAKSIVGRVPGTAPRGQHSVGGDSGAATVVMDDDDGPPKKKVKLEDVDITEYQKILAGEVALGRERRGVGHFVLSEHSPKRPRTDSQDWQHNSEFNTLIPLETWQPEAIKP